MIKLTSPTAVAAVLICSIVITSCEGRKFAKLGAEDKRVIEKLEKLHGEELRCLERIDAKLASKWSTEVKKIPTTDLGRIKTEYVFREPSKPIYFTSLQEWVMESGSPAKKIDKCIRRVKENVVPLLSESDVRCMNALSSSRINLEKKLSKDFVRLLNTSSIEQLPFRRFISFHEFTELMFQNRNPDALTSTERSVYEHSESQLSTEEDKDRRMFIMQQRCEWKNARALKESPNPNATLKEFESQVRDLFNRKIGHYMIRTHTPLNLTLFRQRHEKWLGIHREMGKQLKREVSKLRTEKKSSQWLCEYALTLADKFFDEQSPILTDEDENEESTLRIEKIAEETRAVELVLKKRKDIRRGSMNSLAKKIEDDSRCLNAFSSLVKQHHLFESASVFMDSRYTYPELNCNIPLFNFGVISPVVCNCIGSFCAAFRLAVLIADEYKMVRAKDGLYKVVRVDKLIKNGRN